MSDIAMASIGVGGYYIAESITTFVFSNVLPVFDLLIEKTKMINFQHFAQKNFIGVKEGLLNATEQSVTDRLKQCSKNENSCLDILAQEVFGHVAAQSFQSNSNPVQNSKQLAAVAGPTVEKFLQKQSHNLTVLTNIFEKSMYQLLTQNFLMGNFTNEEKKNIIVNMLLYSHWHTNVKYDDTWKRKQDYFPNPYLDNVPITQLRLGFLPPSSAPGALRTDVEEDAIRDQFLPSKAPSSNHSKASETKPHIVQTAASAFKKKVVGLVLFFLILLLLGLHTNFLTNLLKLVLPQSYFRYLTNFINQFKSSDPNKNVALAKSIILASSGRSPSKKSPSKKSKHKKASSRRTVNA